MKKAIQLCAVLMLLASQASVWAQGIVVMGSGSADFKADRMVLKGTLSKESEDAGDALASLQALQARLKKAFAESDVEGLEIKQGGVSLGTGGDQNQQMAMVMMAGGNQPDMTPKVRAACEYFFSFPLTGLTELVESVGRIHSGARELDVKFSTGAVNEQMMVVMALSGQEPPTADPAIYFEVGQSAAVEKAAFGKAFPPELTIKFLMNSTSLAAPVVIQVPIVSVIARPSCLYAISFESRYFAPRCCMSLSSVANGNR